MPRATIRAERAAIHDRDLEALLRLTRLRFAALAALLVVLGLLAVPAANDAAAPESSGCPPALSPGDHAINVVQDGMTRVVYLHVPKGGNQSPLALVLALGGAGQSGLDFAEDSGYSRLADRARFLVAYPTATGPRPFWNMNGHVPGKPDDVEFIRMALDSIEDAACVDRGRVYATGVSNGGGMAARLGCDLADRLTAVAPVAGGYGTLPACHPARALPILEIHGMADQVVPYAGKGPQHSGNAWDYVGMWRHIDGCQGAPRRTTLGSGVTQFAWQGCAAGSEVVHVRIDGEPHGWPGWGHTGPSPPGPFSSTGRTWSFFASHAVTPPPR
jgi:polyhydroxybutyrate depolymerase